MGKSTRKDNKPQPRGQRLRAGADEQAQLNNIVYVGAGIFATVAALILPYMLFFSSAGVTFLPNDDFDQLKTVFYGGDPWVVVCQQKDGLMKAVIDNSLNDLAQQGVKVGVVQCSTMLPSNKTISQKFKLERTKPVTAFLCVNGKKPVQVPKADLRNADALVKWVKPRAKMKIGKIEKSQPLFQHCYNYKLCGLVVKYGELSNSEFKMIEALATSNRAVAFNVVNTQNSKFSLSKRLPDDSESPLFVMFKKAKGENGTDETAVKLHKGGFDKASLAAAIADAPADAEDEFKVLKKKPTVKPRRRKKEQAAPRRSKPSSSSRKNKGKGKGKAGKPSKQEAADEGEGKGEGLTSEAERERRRKLDEEMESMFEAVDDEEAEEEEAEEESGDDEDDYEEIAAEEEEEM